MFPKIKLKKQLSRVLAQAPFNIKRKQDKITIAQPDILSNYLNTFFFILITDVLRYLEFV